MKRFGERIQAKVADITQLEVDAVVNAANGSLMGGGGVDGAIHRAGGPAILAECKELRRTRYPDGLPVGEAAATTAGGMPARYVIHTVGPVWHGGTSGEPEKLRSCYRNALKTAAELGCKTIAFPAISTGVFGYPPDKASAEASAEVAAFLAEDASLALVLFALFNDAAYDTFIDNAAF